MRSKTGGAARALKDIAETDIADQIAMIEGFIAGFDEELFYAGPKTVYAVTWSLEIISEAPRRLPGEVRNRDPGIPWKNIAGAGNVYRHDYEYVDERDIWLTVKLLLPALKEVAGLEHDAIKRNRLIVESCSIFKS